MENLFDYRKPFDLPGGKSKEFKQKKAASHTKSGLFENWLPERNAQQNFFTYSFEFLMNPIKKNHPGTEYRFQRIPANLT